MAVPFVLLATIIYSGAAKADQIPEVTVDPAALNISVSEGQTATVNVTITYVTGPAIVLASVFGSIERVSGEASDGVLRTQNDFSPTTCADKMLSPGQSCQYTETILTFPLDPNEDKDLGVTLITKWVTFTVVPGHKVENSLRGGYDVTVDDPGCPHAPGSACSATPEPSPLLLLFTGLQIILGALAAGKNRGADLKFRTHLARS